MGNRFIGGESAHRSFFGGIRSKPQIIGLITCALLGWLGVMWVGWPGLVVGVVLALAVFAATVNTHNGSWLERRERRQRWKTRVSTGTDRFVPYSAQAWEDAHAAAADVRHGKDRAKVLAAVRSRPDGADGMGWLQSSPNVPGIAWHTPAGEEAYLSVAFEVSGQLRGAETGQRQEQVQAGFGTLMANHASPSSLVRGIQSITRVLPPDLALNEAWVEENLSPEALDDAVASYQEVLTRTGNNTFVQRHIKVLRWPLSGDFLAAAAQYGEGRDGWRALMVLEIDSMVRALRGAHLGVVKPMSARGVVAMILHQQNPSRPPLMVAGVSPRRMGLASHDDWNAHWVKGQDPFTGEEVVWGHRTAMITASQMESGERSPYWLLALLHNAGSGARTLSFQKELVPADQARALASKDVVRDMAAVIAKQSKGQLVDPATDVNLRSARARGSDLMPGSGQHGVNWVGFITISAKSHKAMTKASRQLTETAANSAGIQKLVWMDTYQSAASGTTWPIFRGLKPAKPSTGTKLMNRLAGNVEKEEKVA
jgi:hypothetical protein